MLKRNWNEVQDRYRAFWRGEALDRPPVVFDTVGPWQNSVCNGAGHDDTKAEAMVVTRHDVPADFLKSSSRTRGTMAARRASSRRILLAAALSLAACGVTGAAEEQRGRVASHMNSAKDEPPMSQPQIVMVQPAARPVEGLPIGNGRMGTLVWTTPGAVEFQINRVDVFAVNRDARGKRFGAAGWTRESSTDYGGACTRVSIAVGGEPFHPGPHFAQRLSLADARCEVGGERVRAACWVAAEDDVLVVEVTDERDSPQPIEVKLAMWREPEVRIGPHSAAYAWRQGKDRVAVVQTFREAKHFCASAAAVSSPGSAAQFLDVDAKSRILRLPPARGSRRVLIASVASMDGGFDAGAASEQVLTALAASEALAEAEDRHRRWWREFCGRTFVRIKSSDGRGEQAARDREIFLYHMACTSRGAFPPKWNGAIFLTDGDARDWGNQYWLWTTEMLYWPLHAADASDLAEPFFEMHRKALPSLATAARQRWNADGLFLPEVMPCDGPAELPEDLVAEYRAIFSASRPNTGISPQLAAACAYDLHLSTLLYAADKHPGAYSWVSHTASSGAEVAAHAWWRYRYTGDQAWLRSHAYPLLRGVAEFYRSLARRGDDGRRHIHGTNAHEDFWGVTDSIMDLAAIRGTLPLAIRAAEILKTDAELRGQWKAFLAELAPYPLGADPRAKALTGAALADDAWGAGYLGTVNGSHNSEDVQLTPIFPFEDWTLETREAAMDAVAKRTLALAPQHRAVLGGAKLSTALRSPIAAVRAGAGEELPAILESYRAAFAPLQNGFSLFEQITPGYQAHSIEHLGLLTMILQEALLQSVSPRPGEPEVIRVFPAWPRAWDAEFRLLARGGFLVTAVIHGGEIQTVEIESRRGEECRIRNPWAGPCRVTTDRGEPVTHTVTGDLVLFQTESRSGYRIENEVRVTEDVL
jgi:hypothetical protein